MAARLTNSRRQSEDANGRYTRASRQDKRVSARSDERILEWLSGFLRELTEISARFPTLVDSALAAATLAVSLLGLHDQHRLGPLSIAFGVAIVAPLPLRRRRPIAAFGLISVIALLQWLLDVPQLADASVLFALYWIARDSPAVSILGAALVAETGAILAAVRWAPADPLKIWVGLTGLTVAATVLGITVRQRQALLASLEERAARLEVERDREGRLGAAAERARIAREMHDIVSHNLTVMIALADAATYAMHSRPEEAESTIERVSATGRLALGEMRRLLGVLREQPTTEPFEPQPSLAQLDDLIARVEAAGLPVSLELEGDPHGLDEGVQVTVYRVVQEALTNTLKHAIDPAGAVVRLVCRSTGGILLEIVDDGHTLPFTETEPGAAPGGRGLTGMQERATAYGGAVEAGPRLEGGWRVRLQLFDVDEARLS
jgi:signal transduction histidine kinase